MRVTAHQSAAKRFRVISGGVVRLRLHGPPSLFERRDDGAGLGRTNAVHLRDLGGIAATKSGHAVLQKLTRKLNRVLAGYTGSDEDRYELCIRERVRSMCEQTLAGAIIER